MNTIFSLVKANARDGAKLLALVTEVVKAKDYAKLVEAAQAIDNSLPVKKTDDGKDANRSERNNLLSILRMALRRASKKLELPYTVTVKRVEGTWLVEETVPEAKANGNGEGEESDDKLLDATELVVGNLKNPIVLARIRAAMAALANS